MADGVSAMKICDAIQDRPDISYDIVDCFQELNWRSISVINLQESGCRKYIRFHEECSEIQFPQFLKNDIE